MSVRNVNWIHNVKFPLPNIFIMRQYYQVIKITEALLVSKSEKSAIHFFVIIGFQLLQKFFCVKYQPSSTKVLFLLSFPSSL